MVEGAIAFGVIVIVLWLSLRSRSATRKRRETRGQAGSATGGARATEGQGAGYSRDDAWEGAFWEARDPRDLTVNLQLEYTDTEGSRTRRRITTRSFDNGLHHGILIAHCHMRNATRTFRMDRVKSAIDMDTGEVIEDLKAYLNAAYQRSPQRARDTLFSDFAELLKVLLYVAKADGQFRSQEKEVVRRHLRALVGDPRMTDEMIDRLFRDLTPPSLHTFKIAVGRVLAEQLMPPDGLLVACREIVATQKTVSAPEAEALQYIEDRISRETRTG